MDDIVTPATDVVEPKADPVQDKAPEPKAPDPVQAELLKLRAANKDLSDRADTAIRSNQEMKENKLKQEGNFQELATKYRDERDEAVSKHEKTVDALILDKKHSAVREAALRAGITHVDDVDLFDLSNVQVETTSNGRYIVHNADDVVATQKALRPNWFTTKNVPNVSTDNVGVTRASDIDLTAVMKAEKEARISKNYTEYIRVAQMYQKNKALKLVR